MDDGLQVPCGYGFRETKERGCHSKERQGKIEETHDGLWWVRKRSIGENTEKKNILCETESTVDG